MTHAAPPIFLATIATVLAAALGVACPAAAETAATPWRQELNARVRLVDGGALPASGERLAGIEIELVSGFKTYWRNPGDSGGIPPGIDVTGSRNVAASRVLYPAPHRFTDPTGDSIGYKGRLVFPVGLKPANPAAPVDVDVKLSIGICREICIPIDAELSLSLPPGPRAPTPAMAEILASVPATGGSGPKLVSARFEGAASPPRLVFEVAPPQGAGAASVDLFIEGPAGLDVPMAKVPPEAAGALMRFVAPLDDAAAAQKLKGERLTITVVSDRGASETSLTPTPTP